jgi:hypothetical protein
MKTGPFPLEKALEAVSKSNRFKGSEPNKGLVSSQSKIHFF